MDNKPLVSIILFTYNQEKYIIDAVSSITSQDYSPLEIIISDDCSNDNTYNLAKKVIDSYQGENLVLLRRNERNLGVGSHVNKLMDLTKGELIVAAAGDDISYPDRVSETVKVWLDSGKEHLSLCSEMNTIDGEGKNVGKLPYIKPVTLGTVMRPGARWIYGASHAWHRSLFDIFGPLREDVVSEDKAIGFRSLLLGQKIAYIEKPLVKYRFHDSSITKGFSDDRKLRQKISSVNSYIDDFETAQLSSHVDCKESMENDYQELVSVRDGFMLREAVLASSPLRAMILLTKNWRKLTFVQKKNLFLKSLSV